jgi:type IV secretion system protein VirB9
MRPRLTALLAALVLQGAGEACAQAIFAPAPGDSRIRTYAYDPDHVVPLDGVFGYETMIQFGPGERLENVAIGDGSSWQVTPNKGATLLFVKPMQHDSRTNMTVVTDRRAYLFELEVSPEKPASDRTYVVRFTYPADPVVLAAAPPPPPGPPERKNTRYTYTGARELLPSEVFDDGRSTYFRWSETGSTPAIFALAPDGSESLVNYSFHDGYQVVEQVGQRFKLRNGKAITTVINDAWSPPAAGAEAPRPHDAKTAAQARHDEGRS